MGFNGSFGVVICVLLGLVIQGTDSVPVDVTMFVDFDSTQEFSDVERTIIDSNMTQLLVLRLLEDSKKLVDPVDLTASLDSTATLDPTASLDSDSAASHTRLRRAPCSRWGQPPPIPLPCR